MGFGAGSGVDGGPPRRKTGSDWTVGSAAADGTAATYRGGEGDTTGYVAVTQKVCCGGTRLLRADERRVICCELVLHGVRVV
jgi:hypothetical protein